MKNISKLVLWVLLAISLVALFWTMFGAKVVRLGAAEGNDPSVVLTWTYVLMGVAILFALAGALLSMLSNPRGAKGTLIGFVIFAVVVVIAVVSAMNATEPILLSDKTVVTDNFQLMVAQSSITITAIMMGAAIVIAILSAVKSGIGK